MKKEKEQGCYEDFIECLKLYDKREDGKMVLAELSYALLALGKCVLSQKQHNMTKQIFSKNKQFSVMDR